MNRKRQLRRYRRRLRARPGVSLIELIVASTILMLGLLAIVGVSASVARSLGEARIDGLAALAAQSRFEQLVGTKCASLTLNTATTATSRSVTEKYVVKDGGNNTRVLEDTVTWITRKGARKTVFVTLIPCRPGEQT